jgi:hypothetical protein
MMAYLQKLILRKLDMFTRPETQDIVPLLHIFFLMIAQSVDLSQFMSGEINMLRSRRRSDLSFNFPPGKGQTYADKSDFSQTSSPESTSSLLFRSQVRLVAEFVIYAKTVSLTSSRPGSTWSDFS